MKKIFCNPLILLVLQAIIMLTIVATSPEYKVLPDSDTGTYLSFFNSDKTGVDYIGDIFSGYRTIGYPLFLKISAAVSPDYKYLPLFQYLVHVLAVFAFWRALTVFGFSRWTAFVAASPLFYSMIVTEFCFYIMSDSLAISFAIISMSFLLMAVSRRRCVMTWVALSLSVFATYQIRPAYIFLIPLAPLAGAILSILKAGKNPFKDSLKKAVASGLLVLMVMMIPFLAFCSFRKVVSGHFGITSFGGMNIASIAFQLLTDDTVELLQEDLRPFARQIIEERKSYGLPDGINEYVTNRDNYVGVYYNFPPTFAVSSTAYEKTFNVAKHENTIHKNLIFSRLAKEIICIKPKSYMKIVWESFGDGIGGMVRLNLTFQALMILWFFSGMLITIVLLPGPENRAASIFSNRYRIEFSTLLVIGVSFFITKILLIAMVEMPINRYVYAAGVFLPSLVSFGIFSPWIAYFDRSEKDL